MDQFVIETERLFLCKLNDSHANGFFELNNDEAVIRFTGDEPFESIRAAEMFLKNYNQYSLYGYGRWAVHLKSNHEFIGWCGLKYNEDIDSTDIGFRLFKVYWNKGFATEAAMACISYGFDQLKLKRIIGRVVKANIASIKVLEKCGLHFIEDYNFHGMPGSVYEITNVSNQI